MKSKIIKYFQWLFQGNILYYNSKGFDNELLFEGKSWTLWKVLFNSIVSLSIIFLPILGVVFNFRHPVIIIITILFSLGGFLLFCAGMIAFAYQPFWLHKNKILFKSDRLTTVNSIGFSYTYYPYKIYSFKIRYEFMQSGVVNIQFWINNNIRYEINAYIERFVLSESEIFESFKYYMLGWGLNYIDILPKNSEKTGTFIFQRKGKTFLDPNLSFIEIQKITLESQLKIGESPELIANYLFAQENDELMLIRPKSYKYKMWFGFYSSLFIGGGINFGLIYSLVFHNHENNSGIYFMIVIISLLWVILSLAFFLEALLEFKIKVNSNTFYLQHKKGKGKFYSMEEILGISGQGTISRGRFTTITGQIFLLIKDKEKMNRILLQTIDSNRPEKIDTQLVRDSVYERSMQVCRLLAKPMNLKIKWEGFKE